MTISVIGSFVAIQEDFRKTLSPIQDFTLRQVFTLTLIISAFALILTEGKTLLLVLFIMTLGLIVRGHVYFKIPSIEQIKEDLPHVLWIVPVLVIQGLYQVKYPEWSIANPSNDIIYYAKIAVGVLETGIENNHFPTTFLYPKEFEGLSLYHFFELYLTGILYWITGCSASFLLNLSVYPLLLFYFILVLRSLQDQLDPKVTLLKKLLILLILFVGPIYFNSYRLLLNDGEVLDTTVFSIGGFVRQTLPFSYFGQKHLPVYLFGGVALFFLIRKEFHLFTMAAIAICSASIGSIVAVIACSAGIILFNKSLWRIRTISLWFGLVVVLVLPYLLFKAEINKEAVSANIYFQYFLTNLNWKGELLRLFSKFFVPAFWFSILYFPFVLIIASNWKLLKSFPAKRDLATIVSIGFFSGCSTLVLLIGMNTDQFLTNVLPLFNLTLMILSLYLIGNSRRGSLSIIFLILLTFYNIGFSRHYSYHQHQDQSPSGNIGIYDYVMADMERSGSMKMAYLLSDSIVEAIPPLIWYPEFPAKYLMISRNFFSLHNINWPYTSYPLSSASISFSHENQMKIFLGETYRPREGFDSVQIRFMRENEIDWLVLGQGAVIPQALHSRIDTVLLDQQNNEAFVRIKRE